jgi:hypothetical protein
VLQLPLKVATYRKPVAGIEDLTDEVLARPGPPATPKFPRKPFRQKVRQRATLLKQVEG